MFWRKWLVRGLVFSLLGGFLAVGYLYQRWTNPAAVRRQVLARLHELFPGAEVTLDSAHLRLLGGVALGELRLTRRDDPDRADFAYLPSAVLYHDKEQILDGRLAFRKVELYRPRLRVVRDRRGRWNLAGLTAPAGPLRPLPTVVVHQGTLVLEDGLACPGSLPLEVTDVNLTLLNDPLATVAFEGSGRCELAGPVHIEGTWRRGTNAFRLALRASEVTLSPALVQRLACYAAEAGAHARGLTGQASLTCRLAYRPGSAEPWSHDLRWALRGGRLEHPALPLPVEDLNAMGRCQGGAVTVARLAGRVGPSPFRLARAWVRRSGGGVDFEVEGRIEHLPVNDALFARLPEQLARLKTFQDLYRPRGPASLGFHFRRRGGRWEEQFCRLTAEGMSGSFKLFPYRLDGIRGQLSFDLCRKVVRTDLTGYTGARPVTVRGVYQGEKAGATADFTIRGDDIPLDAKLIAALPTAYQKLARAFHPAGRGDFDIRVHHAPGKGRYDNHYALHVHHATVEWEQFPYRLFGVSGDLDVLPDHWEFHNFRGEHHGGTVRATGRSYPAAPGRGAADGRVAVEITGEQVRLDQDLKAALAPFPALTRAWETFLPAGRLKTFTARIDRLPRQPQDLDIAVEVQGCAVLPTFFPYALRDLSGHFHYGKNRLRMVHVRAAHGQSRLLLDQGEVTVYPGGGVYANLKSLRGEPLVLDADLQEALPAVLKKACQTLELNGPVGLDTHMIVSLGAEPGGLPDVYWNGVVRLHEAHFQVGLPVENATGALGCLGRHNGRQLLGIDGNLLLSRASVLGQPFHDVHVKLNIAEDAPDVLILGVKAPLFGGEISGPCRVELSSTLRYELDLTASQIGLDAFGRHNIGTRPQLSGLVGGRLHLEGKGSGAQTLEGAGSLDMPRGRLYDLPLLLDLLKFLELRWPDKTAFEQAHAAFTIHGEQFHFNQLELLGNAVSFHGRGDMKLDGTDLRLDLTPVWGRIEQVLPPVWQPIPSTIGKNLLKVEVRGKVGKDKDLHFHKKPVPGLMGPVGQMRDWLTGTLGVKKPAGPGGLAPAPVPPPTTRGSVP